MKNDGGAEEVEELRVLRPSRQHHHQHHLSSSIHHPWMGGLFLYTLTAAQHSLFWFSLCAQRTNHLYNNIPVSLPSLTAAHSQLLNECGNKAKTQQIPLQRPTKEHWRKRDHSIIWTAISDAASFYLHHLCCSVARCKRSNEAHSCYSNSLSHTTQHKRFTTCWCISTRGVDPFSRNSPGNNHSLYSSLTRGFPLTIRDSLEWNLKDLLR